MLLCVLVDRCGCCVLVLTYIQILMCVTSFLAMSIHRSCCVYLLSVALSVHKSYACYFSFTIICHIYCDSFVV